MKAMILLLLLAIFSVVAFGQVKYQNDKTINNILSKKQRTSHIVLGTTFAVVGSLILITNKNETWDDVATNVIGGLSLVAGIIIVTYTLSTRHKGNKRSNVSFLYGPGQSLFTGGI